MHQEAQVQAATQALARPKPPDAGRRPASGARLECRPALLEAARRHLVLAAALVGVAGLATLAGCGGESKADPAKGKQLFVQRCGSCHTLADAQTRGTIGPDLDAAFAQSIRDGLGRDTIEDIVAKQIELPMGPEMPANLVTGEDAESVAKYVAQVAARKSSGGGGAPAAGSGGGGGGGEAKANAKNEVSIPADPTGQLKYEFESATAKPGNVTLLSKNESPVPHDISVKGGGMDKRGNEVSNGGTSKVSAKLEPNEYTFYCSVPGHEQGGMKGTLTVK